MTNSLHRTTENKMVAGICATIAERTNLDLNVTRLVVAGTTVLGTVVGIGLTIPVLYALAWILIPAAGEEQSIAQRWFDKPKVQDAMNKTQDALSKKL
ncbi:PspC domain-containing protein [Actinocorallia longicatena]|uniref:Phage shock protein PspC N-terminal domain-containing protein n=1 Tax=Actinocorallia longicatena TaxID=111803 RepID=A0ABP6QN55_9ACTN